jgi:hypothetical protein
MWYWEDSWGFEFSGGGVSIRAGSRRHNGYVWRPGYWIVSRPDWVWIPAHYLPTPRGYVFVAGYWDYPLERRGVLYAPVYFERPALIREVRYEPAIAIDIDVVVDHLFTRPRHCGYYFGDYYDVTYSRRGYRPFFEVDRRECYDPVFVHLRARNGWDDTRWVDMRRREYEIRRDRPDARPSRTYTAQVTRLRGRDEPGGREDRETRSLALARPANQVTAARDGRVRVTKMDSGRREDITRRSREVTSFKQARQKAEAGEKGGVTAVREGDKAQRVRMGRSPISPRSRTGDGARQAPQKPASPDSPEPKKIKVKKRDGDARPEQSERKRDDDKDKDEKRKRKGDD